MRPSIHGPVRRATAKPGRLKNYRLRVVWEREWERDPRYEAKCRQRAQASRQRERFLLGVILLGALLGATLAAEMNFRIYELNISEKFRYENKKEPSQNSVVYAVESPEYGLKGFLVS